MLLYDTLSKPVGKSLGLLSFLDPIYLVPDFWVALAMWKVDLGVNVVLDANAEETELGGSWKVQMVAKGYARPQVTRST